MTRTIYFALAALAALLLAPAAHAQSLTLNSGDIVTISGAGTVGTINGQPVANSNTSYTGTNSAVATNGTAAFTLGAGGVLNGYGHGLTVNGSGLIAVTGGSVSASVYTFYDTGTSPVTISGGTFTAGYFGEVVSTNSVSSSVNITGGSFTVQSGGYDLVTNSGSIDLYGAFNGLTLGQVQVLAAGSSSFFGTLQNNTAAQTFTYQNSGVITLHDVAPAPEPSQWAVLAMGTLGLGTLTLRARRRAC